MGIATIALFFIYTYCLGFTASSFVKNSENFLEKNLMRIGFGLSLLPFLVLVLNIVKVPADWRIILALSLAYPAYYTFKHYKEFDFNNLIKIKITKTDISILLMLVIFVVNFYVYLSGTFAYPYLEDDDSWAHTFGAKYVSMRGNVFSEETDLIRYINPYPPAYDVVMGVLHQTNNSLYWTMKFFNALIISLSTVFFYFFVKELTGDRNKALFAAFALLSVPAFMSHFIWAISIAVPLYFVAFYALERIKQDKKSWVLAALVMVSAFIASPTHSAYFGLLLILYLIAKAFIEGKAVFYYGLASVSGLSLSFIFWWIPMIIRHGLFGTLKGLGIAVEKGTGALAGVGGTGDRVYTFKDFFFAQKQNMITNPIGIGVVLSILLVIALAYILFKYKDSLKENKNIAFISFLILTAVMLFLLFSTYTKAIWVEGKEQSIPFNVFISDQFFLIASLTFSILVLVTLVIANYTCKDFKDSYLIIAIIWLTFLFYAVNAAPFKFKLSPFRSWMLLAIPVCILAAEGAFGILELSKKSAGKIGVYLVLGILLFGIYFTSTQQKMAVNTAIWPPGAFWTSQEEIQAYLWMKENLPKNSKVFTFWNNGPIIGMDMFSCHWCKDVRGYMDSGFNESANENYNWLKSKGYEYFIIDGQTVKWFGQNESINKLQEFAQSGLRPVFQNQGAVIFKIS
ncbi:MAG: hypothetical protein AABX34_00875 [Nanoarchaeota archaeon]